jgi:hypothetical protein
MIYKPRIEPVELSTALQWRGGQFLCEEKLDGRWYEVKIGNSIIAGEMMSDGKFYAFDLVRHNGLDCRALPLRERLNLLDGFRLLRPMRGNGGEFLEAILANGGEGIVAKDWQSPFGCQWFKAKRKQVFYVVVSSKASDGRQSVTLKFAPFQDVKNGLPEIVPFQDVKNLEPAGSLALRGEKFDAVRPGSILKVEAFGRHKSGLLREARLDLDAPGSWLVKY